MNKRDFLKTAGGFVAASMLPSLADGASHADARTNWSGNYVYGTDQLLEPQTVQDVQHAVQTSSHLRALGSRHSFNGIADSKYKQISLKHLDEIVLNREAGTVTVGAGVTYSQLAPYLDSHGYGLHNLASLPQITVAGAVATATHGSGNTNGNLATAVTAMEMVTGNGDILSFSPHERNQEQFAGVPVHLGSLGIVTKVTLRVEPTYQVSQVVYQDLPMDVLEHRLEEIFASGYSVSFFTDWQKHRINQVWIKRRVEAGSKPHFDAELFGAKQATQKLHPLAGHPAESCTDQLGIPGPWYDRLPHFRIGFTPSSGAELQSEYLIPRDRGYEAVLAIEQLRDQIAPHLFISELRSVAADSLWMSTANGRPSMGIHFTWKPEWPAVKQVLPLIEEKLAPFAARPHWGKLFTMAGPRIRPLYPELAQYQKLVAQYDPQGKFRNEFMTTSLFGS